MFVGTTASKSKLSRIHLCSSPSSSQHLQITGPIHRFMISPHVYMCVCFCHAGSRPTVSVRVQRKSGASSFSALGESGASVGRNPALVAPAGSSSAPASVSFLLVRWVLLQRALVTRELGSSLRRSRHLLLGVVPCGTGSNRIFSGHPLENEKHFEKDG